MIIYASFDVECSQKWLLDGIIILDAVIAIVSICWQPIGRSLTLRSQSPSARKLASVIATVFVEICSKSQLPAMYFNYSYIAAERSGAAMGAKRPSSSLKWTARNYISCPVREFGAVLPAWDKDCARYVRMEPTFAVLDYTTFVKVSPG